MIKSIKPIRRREHQVPTDAGQRELFVQMPAVDDDDDDDDESSPAGGPRFKKDNPKEIVIGDTRLDQYLRNADMEWVLRLRDDVVALDYSKFIALYDGKGRRPFHPRAIVGLIVYGTLMGRSTLRELETLARLDAGAWWMTGGAQPDHSVIGRFLKKHSEQLTDEFFVQAAKHVAKKMKMGPGTVGVDGTVIEAASSRFRALTVTKLDEKLKKLDAARTGGDGSLDDEIRETKAAHDVAVERTEIRNAHGRPGEACAVVGEPESVVQGLKNKLVAPSYKPVVLTTKRGLIAGISLEPSNENDAVRKLLNHYERVFGAMPRRALLDAGFHSGELLALFCERNIDALCPAGKAFDEASFEKKATGKYPKSAFTFDDDEQTYLCPAGKLMRPAGTSGSERYFDGVGCSDCPLKKKCTAAAKRKVTRYEHDDEKDAMRAVFQQKRARKAYAERPQIAETTFAVLKNQQGFTRFRRRGRQGATLELAIQALALNLGRSARGRFFLWLVVEARMANPTAVASLFAGRRGRIPSQRRWNSRSCQRRH